MKILFSAAGLAGHTLPMVPLADAAAAAGHEVAFVTSADQAELLRPRTVLPAGPTVAAALAEVGRRTGGADGKMADEGAIEMFPGVRLDLTFDDELAQARRFDPDLIVGEFVDFVAPLVAAVLDVPVATVAISAPLPVPFLAAMDARWREQYVARSIVPRPRVAYLDPLPPVLRLPNEPVEPDTITLRPEPNPGDGAEFVPPPLSGRSRVLVTMGTTVDEPELLGKIVAGIVSQDVDVLVTTTESPLAEADPRVHPIGFVPLAAVLPHVDAVVSAAGMGTILASLAAGLPMVLRPVLADQPWNAARLSDFGAARTIEDPADAGAAVLTVLDDDRYRVKAGAAADSIASMHSASEALELMLRRAFPA